MEKTTYVVFWDYMDQDLLDVYTQQLDEQHLAAGMDQGPKTLLYNKRTKDKLNNWRLIILLNFCCKLLTKVLADHFKSVIGAVILVHDPAACVSPPCLCGLDQDAVYGCPFSLFLLICAMEPLAQQLKRDTGIWGIKMLDNGGLEVKTNV